MEEVEIFTPTELKAESYKKLLSDFFKEVSDDLELLNAALKELRLEEMRRLAHKIKGTASSYSAVLLFTKAKQLEILVQDKAIIKLEIGLKELASAIERSLDYAKENFMN